MSYQSGPTPPAQAVPTADERTWAMIAHLSAFAGFFIPVLGHVGGPLIVLLLKGGGSPFVSFSAKEALNFHITVAIVIILFTVLCVLLVGLLLLPLVPVVLLIWFILPFIAALRAREGHWYRYPMTVRLIPEV
jgi:uncharacterized Tic20 family protein